MVGIIIFLKKHYLAFIFSVLVGLIYVAPHLFFVISLGDKYQGLPLMATANEDAYILRIREILDGHYMVGSPVYFEYKNEWPMMPPLGEIFYALPSLLTGISLTNILIVSRFILPLILFLLVYFLVHNLSSNINLLSNKINAIAGALLVTLGYVLVDYRSLFSLLFKGGEPGGFLLWARPVNPILGAIFLFSFLLCLWFIINNSQYKKALTITASIFLSLMVGNYFFSWGIALSIIAVLILMYLFKKEFRIIKSLFFVIFLTVVITSPFFYMSFMARNHPWYQESVLRNGLFYTHQPLLNKITLAGLLFYALIFIGPIIKRLMIKNKVSVGKWIDMSLLKNWQIFTLSLLLGSFWAFNQQVLTGMTIWPYHFVQYSIPLVMVVVLVLIYNVVKKRLEYIWLVLISIVASLSLALGIYTQTAVYKSSYNNNLNLQKYSEVFAWFNGREKDSVVLVNEPRPDWYGLNYLIPAFTHSNIYASEYAYSLMPYERGHFNYLVNLRLRGVSPKTIEKYMDDHKGEVISYLFSNWKGIYGLSDFSDFKDPLLETRIKKFPEDYKEFVSKSFAAELKRYRLDYILSIGPLSESTKKELSNIGLIKKIGESYIYQFK